MLVLCAAAPAVAERNFSAQRPGDAKSAQVSALRLGFAAARPLQLSALDPATADAIVAGNRENGRHALRLGVVRDASGLPGASSDSLAWTSVSGGSAAQWRVAAEGAVALRVQLVVERAPRGASVRFASADDPGHSHESRLPASGSVWSPVIEGDTAMVELFVPAGSDASSLSARVASLAHHVVDPARPGRSLAKSTTQAASCEVDLACVADRDPALARVASAVSRLTYIQAGYVWACTGTLLNPGDGSFTPYYYTAAHCIGDQEAASTVATLWFDDAATCGGSVRSSVQSSGGAQLLVVDDTLDAALLRLNEPPPEGVVYAGWDSLPATDGSTIAGVHHPEGGPKKVNAGSASNDSDARYLAATWTSGITEDGSSGSPLFTAVLSPHPDYLLRGTLVGGTSMCNGAAPTGFDLYTRFDLMWPELAPYLSADVAGSNRSGLWAKADEPGWGLGVSHQQGFVVATLFTYSAGGDPMWLIGSVLREQAGGDFAGDLFRMKGPAFDAAPWGRTVAQTVGTMRITFAGGDSAHLAYTLDGTTVAKDVTPMTLGDGPRPVCSFTTEDRASLTNYQDLWWDPSESGWGLMVAHQGDALFALLFTYGDDGAPLWLAGPGLERGDDGRYAGTLYRTHGPAFDASSWQAASAAAAGTIALRFADGDSATLSYTVDGRTVSKPVTRFAASPSAPGCR